MAMSESLVAHARCRAAGRPAPRSSRTAATRCAISLCGSLRSPKRSALWPAAAQASTHAGMRSRSIRWTHSVQRFDAALAARHVRLLVRDRLVDERARAVRAGHHAVAAADARVPVDQHDAVGALERRAGRADVDAGRLGAVLAHHRQRAHASAQVGEVDLADPLRVGGALRARQPVLRVAGGDAGVAVGRALVHVDEQAPAHRTRRRRRRAGGLPRGRTA